MKTQIPRILVADDDGAVREILAANLRADGYDVIEAEDGEQAAAMIAREGEIDLVFTDLRMPGLDGKEVMHRAKQRDPSTGVIIMTAFADTESAIAAVHEGAYDYLRKPFEDLGGVRRIAARALRERRLAAENRELVRKLEETNRALREIVGDQLKRLSTTDAAGEPIVPPPTRFERARPRTEVAQRQILAHLDAASDALRGIEGEAATHARNELAVCRALLARGLPVA